MLNFLLELSGLASVIFASLVIHRCIKNYNGFNLKKNTVSDCGTRKRTRKLFNPSLAVGGILQMTFFLIVINSFPIPNPFWSEFFIVIFGSSVVVAGLIPKYMNEKIHKAAACTGFISAVIGTFIFHLKFFAINELAASIGIIISALFVFGTLISILKYRVSALTEIFFLTLAAIWNLFFTYVLFFV